MSPGIHFDVNLKKSFIFFKNMTLVWGDTRFQVVTLVAEFSDQVFMIQIFILRFLYFFHTKCFLKNLPQKPRIYKEKFSPPPSSMGFFYCSSPFSHLSEQVGLMCDKIQYESGTWSIRSSSESNRLLDDLLYRDRQGAVIATQLSLKSNFSKKTAKKSLLPWREN